MKTIASQLHLDVEEHLDRLRPALIADGGNVELIGVGDDGTVKIALQGTCATCPAQAATLRIGIEEPLCDALPGVTGVVAV
jgi:Fe-S cluster biogenesis protein NfuA